MSGLDSEEAAGNVTSAVNTPDEKVQASDDKDVPMPSAQEEEAVIKKKYGGILPKKPPLISKDSERAYFDSADWALGKQGGNPNKPKGPLEALRPKLQPTQQQVRSRRSAYASAEGEDGSNAAADEGTQSDIGEENKSSQ